MIDFRKYISPVKYLGTSAVLVLLFGLIFPTLSEQLIPEDTRDSVLVRAIPFVAVFVTIILLYILSIFLIALTFNDRIPYRTHRPIELSIILGIITGVVFLFQPWQLVSYKYGFLLLLLTTLFFILWSHIRPRNPRLDDTLPPFNARDYAAAGAAGLVVLVGLAYLLITAAKPEAPYGYTQRQWDRGLREEQRQAIIEEEEDTFQNFTVPFFIVLSLFPASTAFLLTREVVSSAANSGSGGGRKLPSPPASFPRTVEGE